MGDGVTHSRPDPDTNWMEPTCTQMPEGFEERVRALQERSGLKWTPFIAKLVTYADPSKAKPFLSYQTLFGIFKSDGKLWGALRDMPKWVTAFEEALDRDTRYRESPAVSLDRKDGIEADAEPIKRSTRIKGLDAIPAAGYSPAPFPEALPGFRYYDLDTMLQLTEKGRECLITLLRQASIVGEFKSSYESHLAKFNELHAEFESQHLPNSCRYGASTPTT